MSTFVDSDHLVTVVEGTVTATDYPAPDLGSRKFVAFCLCGWVACRSMEHATANQVAKHRARVSS